MALPFFKKKPDEVVDQRPVRREPPRPVTTETRRTDALPDIEYTPDNSFNSGAGDTSIEVVDTSEGIPQQVVEVAILYANDQIDMAIATMQQFLRDEPFAKVSPENWLMLMELYQLQNRKKEFDDLAMEFVVKFERSPPVWAIGTENAAAPEPDKAGAPGYFAFAAKVAADTPGQFDQFKRVTEKGSLRIDFGKIQQIDEFGARFLLNALKGFRKSKQSVQILGAAALVKVLHKYVEVGRRADNEEAYWLLLLEMLQALNLHDDFENTAVDFAVTYEVSPPSWETTQHKMEVSHEEPVDASDSRTDALHLEGLLIGANARALTEIRNYAQDRNDVKIEITTLNRIDFEGCGELLNTLYALVGSGKSITILGANELIAVLFAVMGISQVANIVKRK